MRYPCPECGQLAIQMTQCMHDDCKEWFVSPMAKDPDLVRRMMMARQPMELYCPACKRPQWARPPQQVPPAETAE